MLRMTLLWMFIGYLGLTAWKDWYRSLCGLILLTGVYRHPDMPSSLFDIPGLNPWNILLFMIVCAWLANRRKDGCQWDMPGKYNTLLWLCLVVIVLGFCRMLWDHDGLIDYARITGWQMPSTVGFWNEYLFNTIKWVIPGILLFDGCRTDARIKLAIMAVSAAYFILALQVIQYVPIYTLLSGKDLSEETVGRLRKNVGYHRTDLAVMLAGFFWAWFSTREIFQFKGWRTVIFPAGLLIFLFSLALTGGRGGYLAWAGMALIFCLFRYRKLFFILPVVMVFALPYAPSLVGRITEGISPEEGVDHGKLTAGRSIAWPLVIEKIGAAPIIGHGREAMKQTGLAAKLFLDYGESAPHPHNAYLEMLLDNGIIGFAIVLSFYWLIIKNSFALFRNRHNPNYRVIGGICVSIVGTQLIGSLTGQTFYPRELSVGVWCSIGLLLRLLADGVRQGKEEGNKVLQTSGRMK